MDPLLRRSCQALLLNAVLCCTLAVASDTHQVPVNCLITVTVTLREELSTNCNSSNWMNETCSDFNSVLSIISHTVLPDSVDCIEVRLMPGRHEVTEVHTIKTNIAIRGASGVVVTFNLSDEYLASVNHSSGKPLYVLSFSDSEYAELSSIVFCDSPGLIGIDNILSVRVSECTFEYFNQGAIDIFNCHGVEVMNSRFAHNGPVRVLKLEAYRGHSGGLSVAYNWNVVNVTMQPTVTISNCQFFNNSASGPSSNIQQSTSTLLTRLLFTGRGGGAAVIINSSISVLVHILNCTFEENHALSYGGGIYLAWGSVSGHVVIINSTGFIRNRTPGGAGGLEMGFAQGGYEENAIKVFVYSCEFTENEATHGGGVYFFSSSGRIFDGGVGNFAHFEDCLFLRNRATEYGGAVGIILPSANSIFDSRDTIKPFEFRNCNFTENDGGSGGAVSMTYFPSRFDGINIFQRNRGRSVVVIGSLVEVYGHMYFIDNGNVGVDGGAIYSTSLGQFQLNNGSRVKFDGNAGNFGAGIVVESLFVPQLFSSLLYNPLCTLLLGDPTLPPSRGSNQDVYVEFTSNEAVVASAVYSNNLDLCSWSSLNEPFFDRSLAYRWNFVNYSDDNSNTAHGSDQYSPLWYVQTEAYRLQVTTDSVAPYAGEVFDLGIKAIDELGNPTTASFRLTDGGGVNSPTSKGNAGLYQFNPAVVSYINLKNLSIPLSLRRLSNKPILNNESIIIETILGDISLQTRFTVSPVECPPGYVLTLSPDEEANYYCQCDFSNPNIVNCNGTAIIIKDGLWASVTNRTGTLSLVTYPCPHEYCQCTLVQESNGVTCLYMVDGNNLDSQCSCRRKGILCGSCKDGYGVSALLNSCVTCHDASGILIVILCFADIVAFVGLIMVAKHFPTWLYPFIFYLQILPYLTEQFPTTFERFHHPLYFVTSALSFYFVYDFCLYHNLSALTSYFFRFLPLFISAIVCLITAIITYKITKYHVKWYGIWWIVLLQYTHVVYTCMTLLNCPALPEFDGNLVPRWYINGEVKCFEGSHAALAFLAIVVLTVCIAVIPLASIIAFDKMQIANRLVKPLTSAFREECKWWSGVELARRFIILIFIIAFPANNYPAIFVLSIFILIIGYVRPYSDKMSNYIELFLGSSVLLLLLLRNTEQLKEELKHIPFQERRRLESLHKCARGVEVEGASGFAWLLFVFYYLPLLAALVGAISWIAYRIRLYVKSREYKPKEVDPSIVNALTRQPSRTEIDLDALAADVDANTNSNNAANIDSREHDDRFQTSYIMSN